MLYGSSISVSLCEVYGKEPSSTFNTLMIVIIVSLSLVVLPKTFPDLIISSKLEFSTGIIEMNYSTISCAILDPFLT